MRWKDNGLTKKGGNYLLYPGDPDVWPDSQWLSIWMHHNAPALCLKSRRACGCHSSQCNTRECIAQGCLRYTKLVTALLLYSGIGYWLTVLIYEFIFYFCVLIFISVFIIMQVNFFTMKWLYLRDFAKIIRLGEQALKSYRQILIGHGFSNNAKNNFKVKKSPN